MNPTVPVIINIPEIPVVVYWVFSAGVFGAILYLGGLHHQVKEICKKFPRVHDALLTISNKLCDEGFFSDAVYTMSYSPIALNDKGKDLLKESRANVYVDAHRESLLEKIRKHKPKTAYDGANQGKDTRSPPWAGR